MSELTARVGDYNSQLPHIVLKEYGRNIQKIAEHIATLPTEEERLSKSKTLIKLMKQLNPKLRDSQDIETKLWHHLHLVANSTLNIGEDKAAIAKEDNITPDKVPYLTGAVKSKHFGMNIQRIAEDTSKIEDPKERDEAISYLGKLMKRYYQACHGERLEDEVIVEQMSALTNGRLQVSLAKVKEEQSFYVELRESGGNRNHSRANSSNNHRRNNNNNKGGGRHNNNRRRNSGKKSKRRY